jgi:hypothetical protein
LAARHSAERTNGPSVESRPNHPRGSSGARLLAPYPRPRRGRFSWAARSVAIAHRAGDMSRNLPNINTGKPWSELDDRDLMDSFIKGEPMVHKAVAQAAVFLCPK